MKTMKTMLLMRKVKSRWKKMWLLKLVKAILKVRKNNKKIKTTWEFKEWNIKSRLSLKIKEIKMSKTLMTRKWKYLKD